MSIQTPGWDESDAEQYAALGGQDHVPILCEAITELVDLRGQRVLDFGCGEGHLTRALIERAKPAAMIGIDTSAALIQTARGVAPNDASIQFRVGDEAALPLDEPVDVVLCSLMLMMCRTRQQLTRTLEGLVGSVRSGGRIVIALTHPCFRRADYGAFYNELPEAFDYWQSGCDYDVQLAANDEHQSAAIRDTHWTLSDYLNAIVEAGGMIDRVDERPISFDESGRPTGRPAFLLIRAIAAD